MSKDFEKKMEEFISFIEKASAADLKQFISAIGETLDVSLATPVQPQYQVQKVETKGEEVTNYNVHLAEVGNDKIPVLKLIRELLQLSLSDSKKIIDSAPCVVMANVSGEVAQETKKKFEERGATIELIGV